MPNGEFEFNAIFNEFLPVEGAIIKLWIGNGSNETTNELGSLYVEFTNGQIKKLGSVMLYELALDNGYQGTREEWLQDVVHIASEQRGISIDVKYQTTDNGTTAPSPNSTWTAEPHPEAGKYIWSKYVITWYDNTKSLSFYSVAYMGKDGTVLSVNNMTGNVMLYGNNVPITDIDSTNIKTYIDNKNASISGNNIKIDSSSEKTIKSYVDEKFEALPEQLVESVNGVKGNVHLYGSNVPIEAQNSTNIKEYIDSRVNSIVIPVVPVTSVNGMTGDVNIIIPVTSVLGRTGDVKFTGSDINIANNNNKSVKKYIDDSISAIPAPPVSSVNGKTGAVVIDIPSVPVRSVNGKIGDVIIDIPEAPVSSVNGKTGTVNIYSSDIKVAQNNDTNIKDYVDNAIENIDIPESPVTSVNGKTGDVIIEIPTLYGTTINIDNLSNQSIKDYVDGLTPETATDTEIDEMFGITT